MSSKNNGIKNTLSPNVKKELNKLKSEFALETETKVSENMDKGNLSSRQNGYIVHNMIENYEKGLK